MDVKKFKKLTIADLAAQGGKIHFVDYSYGEDLILKVVADKLITIWNSKTIRKEKLVPSLLTKKVINYLAEVDLFDANNESEWPFSIDDVIFTNQAVEKADVKKGLTLEEAFKALNGRMSIKESAVTKDVKIKKFLVDDYIKLIGAEPEDYDFNNLKAKFIYTDEKEESAQVGIEFTNGEFAVVGLANDHMCDDYEHMVRCIKAYM